MLAPAPAPADRRPHWERPKPNLHAELLNPLQKRLEKHQADVKAADKNKLFRDPKDDSSDSASGGPPPAKAVTGWGDGPPKPGPAKPIPKPKPTGRRRSNEEVLSGGGGDDTERK